MEVQTPYFPRILFTINSSFSCLQGCTQLIVNKDVGHIQHYRGNCHVADDRCEGYKNNTVIDKSIWSVKDKVIQKVHRSLLDLDLYEN